jgi:hypothetical protein
MTDDADLPRSAPNLLVAIWNSWTASIGRLSKGPPTTSSLLSCPSMVMLPPRPIWPDDAIRTLFVFVGSKTGVGLLPGTRSASSRKLRPFRGSAWIASAVRTPSTAVVTTRAESLTVTASWMPPSVSWTSSRRSWPTLRAIASVRQGAKPESVTSAAYEPGGSIGIE